MRSGNENTKIRDSKVVEASDDEYMKYKHINGVLHIYLETDREYGIKGKADGA